MTERNPPGRKSTTRTIRLDKELDDRLQRLAAEENLSASFVINTAVERYIEWGHFAKKFGVVTLLHHEAEKLLRYLDDVELKEFAISSAHGELREFIRFRFGSFDALTILKTLKLLALAGNFQYEERSDNDGALNAMVVHRRGIRWSSYYEGLLGELFKMAGEVSVRIEGDESEVFLRLPRGISTNGLPFSDLTEEEGLRIQANRIFR